MKNKNILDLPLIQKTIHSKHGKFIKDFGTTYEKIIADRELFLNMAAARINCILDIFIKEKVISEALDIECGPYRKIRLIQKGNNSYVDITTNGIDVKLHGHTYLSLDEDSLFRNRAEYFYNINNVDFDWSDFSAKLLDCIHLTIYTKKEAFRVKIDSYIKDS